MSGSVISVDPALFPSIDAYYEKESADVLRVKSFLQTNCTLESAFGILLSGLKPKYEDARDKTFTALGTIANTMDKLAQQVEGYAKDTAENESSLEATVAAMQAKLDSMQAQITALSVQPSGGGYSGGGGGGGGGGGYVPPLASPSPVTTPPPPSAPPTDTTPPAPPVAPPTTPMPPSSTIEGGGVQVTLGNNDTVTIITGNNDSVGSAAVPGTVPMEGTPGAALPIPGTPIDGGTPALQAHDAAMFTQFWQQEAQHDPLGRTAEQLEAAWEAKTPIPYDPTALGGSTLGFDGATALPIPVSFSLAAPVAASATIGVTR